MSRPRPGLKRRDVWLLPLIFFGTLALLMIGGEVAARVVYPQDDAAEPCELRTAEGARYRPFCVSHTKEWEGPRITQRFNDCGYRSKESCKPRPPGALRVVVVGSSTARGALVNYPESFAARASAFLTERCGGLVDFQNLGTEPPDVNRIDRRMKEVKALRPAAIVMTIGPYDLIHLMDPPRPPGQSIPPEDQQINLRWFVDRLRESRLFLLMQYYLYRDPAFQIRAFLLNGDPADYVREPLSPVWQKRVDDFGDLLGRITALADVPLLVVYIPERAQAALAKEAQHPPGVDPFVLQRALRRTAGAHGAKLLDSTPDFARAADFEGLFYLTDGHPREGGHAAIAKAVEAGLLAEPAFSACGPES